MTPVATVEDYEARYGKVDDEERISKLLQDAANIIASQPGFCDKDRDDTWWGVLETVACAMVHRSLMSGAYAGLSNVSQGAGGYTASVAVYNPAATCTSRATRGERSASAAGASASRHPPSTAGTARIWDVMPRARPAA